MAVSVEWMDETHTLIYVRVTSGSKTPYEDFMAAAKQVQGMLSSVSHPVDAICDTRMQFVFSRHVLEIAYAVHEMTYPNMRLIAFVGRNLAWDFFLIFVRMFGRVPYKFVGVHEMNDALEVIQRVRQEAAIGTSMASAPLN